jgi:hypothetical protein
MGYIAHRIKVALFVVSGCLWHGDREVDDQVLLATHHGMCLTLMVLRRGV